MTSCYVCQNTGVALDGRQCVACRAINEKAAEDALVYLLSNRKSVMHREPDIINEVLTVVWSTVRATGETTLRVILGDKVGSWTVDHRKHGTVSCADSPEGYAPFIAANKRWAVFHAVDIMGGFKDEER